MGKSAANGQAAAVAQQSKSTIARDKLCDGDFDKLVIDTSRIVRQKNSSASVEQPAPVASSSPLEHSTTSGEIRQHQQKNQDEQHQALVGDSKETAVDFGIRPSQPKRPMNAFMVWGQAIRRELHHRFSNVQNALLSKALGRVWKSLDPAEKEPYVRKANLIKANHKRDYPNYRYQPRRFQEKRSRRNMLIGINLNHPVTQHRPGQTNYGLEHVFGGHTTNYHQVAEISRAQYFNHQVNLDEKLASKATGSNSIQPNVQERAFPCGRSDYVTKDIKQVAGGVQTFEYQPYPSAQSIEQSSSNLANSMMEPSCMSYRTGFINDPHECNDFHHQHHTFAPSKQIADIAYSSYHQYTYNAQHHQHHNHHHLQQDYQHQPPSSSSSSYEASQAEYSGIHRGPSADSSNVGYYGTTNVGHVKIHNAST